MERDGNVNDFMDDLLILLVLSVIMVMCIMRGRRNVNRSVELAIL